MDGKKFDVILVGGGVMGCATAYYLLKQDSTLKVAIVEKDASYEKSSSILSDGNIRVQFNIKENIEISLYGLEVLARFSDDMAVGDVQPDVAFRQQGNLFLSDLTGEMAAKRGLALQQEMGCEVAWLTAGEVEQKFSILQRHDFVGGTYGPLDGTMDPNAVLVAYKNKALDLGADLIEGEVVEVTKQDWQITGVRLASGDVLYANNVVNSAGGWATRIADSVGVVLPIQPVKRQVFVLETAVIPSTTLPLIVFPSGLYLIHEHEGVYLCGKSVDSDPVGTKDFTWEHDQFNELLWPELVDYVPSFDRLKVVNGWAGLYAMNTFDGNAILGEWPELKGFYLANGFSGHGFQQCHAVGRYLAELILGQDVTLDLSIFSPKRILENKPVFESDHKLV